jgi:predicted amidohydrolase
MKIALLQSELVWENVQANLVHFSKQIQAITEHVELIVLPEMFTTGFTMNPANCSETMEGEVMQWMKKIAQERQAAITGSLIIKEQDTYFNRLIFVYPNGEYKFYNKRHLFALTGEDKVYGKGNEK